jgi:transcriptional regulator with XRE-family HTH domain
MPENYGARLRQQREERGIALAAVAKQTRIKEPLLEALERDDLSQWPSGFYRRAFFRAYAGAIGCDPDGAMREFLEAYPEPPEVDVVKAMASALDRGESSGMAAGLRDVVGSVGSAIGSLSRLRRPASDETAAPVPLDAAPTAPAAPTASPDLVELARLCTALGRVDRSVEARPLLQDSARILDAKGLIVWLWDAAASHLTPSLVHGYSDRVVAQLPNVRRDADNATAAAFRAAQPRLVRDGQQPPHALAVPMLTPTGCTGVLAIELQRATPQITQALAVATILAAQLAHMVTSVRRAEELPDPWVAVGGLSQGV